jgi:hypothetical protein
MNVLMKWLLRPWALFLAATMMSSTAMAQEITTVTGTIVDASTKEPIPYVSVYFKNAKGVQADSTGHFEISTARNHTQLIFSYIGYKNTSVTIKPGTQQTILVEMTLDPTKNMNNIIIKSKKKIKYTNKDNPAVELIRRVIDHRDVNRPGFYEYLQYEEYEKMQLALSRVDNKIAQSKLLKNFTFVFDNKDTTKIPGKTLIPVYLEERITTNYYRRNPEKLKTYIEAEKKVNFSDLIDSNGISQYLDRLYEKVDIYESNIQLFSHSFMSPISDLAPSFYMYFIRDTVVDAASGTKLVQLYFTPRNTNDLLFRGTMFITLDTNYAVQKLNMTVSPNINLNFIREVYINQDFIRNPQDGKYKLKKSSILTEISISKDREKKTNAIYGERTVMYSDYQFNKPQPDPLYDGMAKVMRNVPIANRDSFWNARRHEALTAAEAKAYKNIDSLRNMRSFKRFVDIANFLMSGYVTRSKFEIGPAHSFYGYNPVEGFKLRFGGRSTPGLSQRMYFETYGAYGFKDKQWKGFLSVAYSLNKQSVYRFPQQYIKASALYDIQIPGTENEFVTEDNILLAIRRGRNDKWMYARTFKLEYVKELLSKLTYSFGIKRWEQEAAGAISFEKPVNGTTVRIPTVTTSELSFELRWAPNEKFYQGLVYRTPIITKYPIFNFRYVKGVKGLFGGEYDYSLINLSMRKRMYMTQLGFNDFNIEGGYAFGNIPYPLMFVHRANQTYALFLNSYNMMNFLEFVSDRYVAINSDHHLNGFLFNRVPLLKKLDLREVFSAKLIVGGVSNRNQPGKLENGFLFPKNEDGKQTTFGLNGQPYFEAGMGIENIFKVLRVEVVKRFTHLNNPDVSEFGVRARVKMTF